MKLSVYGGMANNLYVLAHEVQNIPGLQCRFIRDRNDRFAFSQPSWEDCAATLSYDDVLESSSWSWDRWSQWERDAHWQKPYWVDDPGYDDADLKLEDCFREANLLLVCGVAATVAAYQSGRPYVILPHGGDIRLAAGLVRTPSRRWMHKLFGHPQDRILRKAYERARAVVTHGPLRIGGPLSKEPKSMTDYLPGVRFERLSIPIRPRQRADAATRRAKLNAVLDRLGLPPVDAPMVLFVPSRVDYFWKGQDRLVEALQQLGANNDFHVLFSGWGKDYADLRGRVGDIAATFLPFSVSKQVLYEFFTSVDIVVDQFILGHYGTATQEAMACGAPVMTWNNESEYHEQCRTPPPIINVRSVEDIRRALQGLRSGSINAEAIGLEGKGWIGQNHSASQVADRLRSIMDGI